MALSPLPIDDVLPSLVAAVREGGAAVLRAPTGAGKTTRVPPALDEVVEGMVVVLEPRRIAARAAARRMAAERGERVGESVGYSVRFDRKTSAATRIVVVTEGVLLRRLQSDPFLEGVGAVVFDEFHERSLDSDLALAMVRRVREDARPDLAVVVMSATLDPGPIAEFFGGCAAIESEGRAFPVAVDHVGRDKDRRLEDEVRRALRSALSDSTGDVLVFLPGVGEIRRSEKSLAELAQRENLAVLPLFGDLSPNEQDAVLRAGPRRKVVLATNVAETSVTIEGVTAVVDTGLVRRMTQDPAVGIPRLELTRISRASAEQRAGRAGRTAPGICLRLWPKSEHRLLDERDAPEILRADLAGAALQLLAWGETDLDAFPWFERPPARSLDAARALLADLGATDDSGRLTEVGHALATLPLHPRLSRLLLAGRERGVLRRAALAAAILSERDPIRRPRGEPGQAPLQTSHHSESDLLDRIDALDQFEHHGTRNTPIGALQPGSARFVLRARDQLLRLADRLPGDRKSRAQDPDEALRRALLCAYPDRVARRREPGGTRALMVGGRGVRLAPSSAVLDAELFVCLDLDAGRRGERSEAFVRQASAIEAEWLTTDEFEGHVFDTERETVVRRREWRFRDLVLREVVESAARGTETSAALERAAAGSPADALGVDRPEVTALLERVRFLAHWMPELGLPAFDDDHLRSLLPALCSGKRSFAELRKLPLNDFLLGSLKPAQQQALRTQAPERIDVPSGSHVRLRYEGIDPPVLAVRIQEVFGLAETPRIAAGRVPVLMHLLAPNQRPQQITNDLKSFWDTTYAVVRKELRRRYPRHAWPEDPWAAAPERRPKRRR